MSKNTDELRDMSPEELENHIHELRGEIFIERGAVSLEGGAYTLQKKGLLVPLKKRLAVALTIQNENKKAKQ